MTAALFRAAALRTTSFGLVCSLILKGYKFECKSGSNFNMNEWQKLGRGEGAVNDQKWVFWVVKPKPAAVII
jgi:hypothetical protein